MGEGRREVGATLSGAQDELGGTLWGAKDLIQVGSVQGKCLICFLIVWSERIFLSIILPTSKYFLLHNHIV